MLIQFAGAIGTMTTCLPCQAPEGAAVARLPAQIDAAQQHAPSGSPHGPVAVCKSSAGVQEKERLAKANQDGVEGETPSAQPGMT